MLETVPESVVRLVDKLSGSRLALFAAPGEAPEFRSDEQALSSGVVGFNVLKRFAEGVLDRKAAKTWAEYLLLYGSIVSREEGALELASSSLGLLAALAAAGFKGRKKDLIGRVAQARLATALEGAALPGDDEAGAYKAAAVSLIGVLRTPALTGLAGDNGNARSFGMDEEEFLRLYKGGREAVLSDLSEARRRLLEAGVLPEKPRVGESGLTEAGEILENLLTLRAHMLVKHKYPEPIDWGTVLDGDIETNVSLNHHAHISLLARSYAATGDERFAGKAVSMLRSWFEQSPCPDRRTGLQWRTLEVGGRPTSSWLDVLAYLWEYPGFEAERLRFACFIANSGLYLCAHTSRGMNWFQVEASGLYATGALLPALVFSKEFTAIGSKRLQYENRRAYMPDGLHSELSTGYHLFPTGRLHRIFDISRVLNARPVPELEGVLERAGESILRLMQPDGTLPPLNDNNPAPAAVCAVGGERPRGGYFADLHRYFGREDFAWAAGADVRPPEETAFALPYSGYYVVRSGWEPGDEYLVFDGGWYGGGHQHEDKLNFVYYAGGRTLVCDANIYKYSDDKWERYFRGSRGHNSVMVDGRGQCRTFARDWWTEKVPDPETVFLPSLSRTEAFFKAVYRDGFAPRRAALWGTYDAKRKDLEERNAGIWQRRFVLWLKGIGFLVVDRLYGSGPEEHDFECITHVAPVVDKPGDREGIRPGALEILPGGRTVTREPDRSNVFIAPVFPGTCEIKTYVGEEREDEVRGFATLWQVVPAWEVVYQQRRCFPARFELFYAGLLAGEGEDGVLVTPLEVSGAGDLVAARVLRDGREVQVLVSCDGPVPMKGGDVDAVAEAAVFYPEEGRLVLWDAVRGSARGRRVFLSERPEPVVEATLKNAR